MTMKELDRFRVKQKGVLLLLEGLEIYDYA